VVAVLVAPAGAGTEYIGSPGNGAPTIANVLDCVRIKFATLSKKSLRKPQVVGSNPMVGSRKIGRSAIALCSLHKNLHKIAQARPHDAPPRRAR
jgi:hypothetical protein